MSRLQDWALTLGQDGWDRMARRGAFFYVVHFVHGIFSFF